MEELNLDVPTQRYRLGEAELANCVRPTDVLVDFGRKDFCLVQPDDEGRAFIRGECVCVCKICIVRLADIQQRNRIFDLLQPL